MGWSRRWLAVGAMGALAADVGARRYVPHRRLALHSVGLVGAAAIYPALHTKPGSESRERQREVGGVLACVALTTLAARSNRRSRVLAAGWASHALFDAMHHRSASSLLPDWYPAACAGYDLMLGVALAIPGRAPQ
jgi:hypothetical protein